MARMTPTAPTSAAALRLLAFLLALSSVLLAGCDRRADVTGPLDPQWTPRQESELQAVTLGAVPVVTGLPFPAAFTVDANGRFFYGERFTGRIRIFNPATSSKVLFFTVPNVNSSAGEGGLLGLALHPNFPAAPYVYAYATRNVAGQVRCQILRITASGNSGTALRVIFDTTAGNIHNGGRILFGPDNRLYVVIGEQNDQAAAQNLGSPLGKILRMTANGGVPGDNPFPGSLVFAYGFRNSFGFDFDPQTGQLWEEDNGPECGDELNRVVRGRNHGWGPHATCSTPPPPPRNTNQDGPSPVLPRRFYTPP